MSNSLLELSSITKKIIMSLAGFFLILFLLLHLVINLMLLLNDGGESFSLAVEFMTTNPIIKIMEVVLFAGFIIHIALGITLAIQNWMSRPVGYVVCNKSQTSFLSKYMIYSGIIVGVFLSIHFMNFYFVKLGLTDLPEGLTDRHDFYQIAIALFQTPLYSVIYVAFMIFLGFHLNHAFQSAFQTFGLNHKKYTPTLKALGVIYSLVVSIGFSIIPLYFLLK